MSTVGSPPQFIPSFSVISGTGDYAVDGKEDFADSIKVTKQLLLN